MRPCVTRTAFGAPVDPDVKMSANSASGPGSSDGSSAPSLVSNRRRHSSPSTVSTRSGPTARSSPSSRPTSRSSVMISWQSVWRMSRASSSPRRVGLIPTIVAPASAPHRTGTGTPGRSRAAHRRGTDRRHAASAGSARVRPLLAPPRPTSTTRPRSAARHDRHPPWRRRALQRCPRRRSTSPPLTPSHASSGIDPATCAVSVVLDRSTSRVTRQSPSAAARTAWYVGRMPDRADAGRITDEGVERLRARIGIAEPHPQPPHYRCPNEDAFRHVAESLRRRQPAVVRPRVRTEDAMDGADRVTGARRRRHAHRRRGSHRPRRRDARTVEGRPTPRRARVLRRLVEGMVGAAASRTSHLPAQRDGGVLDKPSEFAERAIHDGRRRSSATTRARCSRASTAT